ncbi:hypothetical protein NECID01_0883 [Nematocida sp. AWRm77]|nr:hypothetical protein NECID01_0883 [Nematocida sp. AWRm77]
MLIKKRKTERVLHTVDKDRSTRGGRSVLGNQTPSKETKPTQVEDINSLQYVNYCSTLLEEYKNEEHGVSTNRFEECLKSVDGIVEHTEYILIDTEIALQIKGLEEMHSLSTHQAFKEHAVLVLPGSLEYIEQIKNQLHRIKEHLV